MPRIFISYRRADSPMAAGRIHDRLAAAFGSENIFKDVDDIPPGVDFRTYLAEEIKLTTVMLVVIGPTWVSAADAAGQSRLHHPADYVRIEVETGLAKQNCRVVPVLLGTTMMPHPEDLPETLARLPFLNAVTIRDDPDFNRDVERLIRWLRGENVDFDVRAAIATFYTAFAEGRWAQALSLLSQIRASGLAPSVFDVDGYEREIQASVARDTDEHERRERQENAQREYEIIRIMAQHDTLERVWQRWQVYRQTYSDVDYDPDGLGRSLSQRFADQESQAQPVQAAPTPARPLNADSPRAAAPRVADVAQPEPGRSNRWLVAGGAAVLLIGLIVVIAWVLLRDQDRDKKEDEGNSDPLQAALERATNFYGGNADWVEVVGTLDGVEMVLVPPGCFMMGSTEEDDEQPPHRVCLGEPYWIDRTEVTNAQFATFEGQAALVSSWTDDNRPRERILWNEAHDFCESRGGRLPTEAEWEYAARGPDAWLYPWGNEFDEDRAVDWNNSGGATASVGSRPDGASWVGALDMAGNVWEWVADWYDAAYYGTLPEEVHYPSGPSAGHDRVLRGGSFNYPPLETRASNRAWEPPNDTTGDIGFRCIRPADASTDVDIPPQPTSAPTSAPEALALTQTLTSTAGITVRYPDGWVGQETELGDLELSNSSEMLAKIDETDALVQPGQLAVVVRNPEPAATLNMGDRPSRDDLMAALFAASDGRDVTVGDGIAILLDTIPATRLNFSADTVNAEGMFIGFVGQDHLLITIVAIAPRGEFASAEALLLDIAASVSYTAPSS